MHFKTILLTFFAAAALATPTVEKPKIVARPKGPIPGSGSSCCSHTPGVCKPECVSKIDTMPVLWFPLMLTHHRSVRTGVRESEICSMG
ncbi:uncharacterized protein CTRU02_208438 [Colletotrichum truncatum]|uniref:Uncharacterized protein n=1 Tax=Colletotrichum truncatum TaxID=5467 RepID=A0ACC3YWC1_COLTU|nr:uncharacterized protein CTRU02_10191 [Colletotrichum truncatum]KAF6787395.1 hypothetical protein CTRU02_10191 [Colletotrichum truncatum]